MDTKGTWDHWPLYRIVILACVLFVILWCCTGCTQEFVKESVKESRIFGGMIENDENCPPDKRALGRKVRQTNEEVQVKIGEPKKIITENNLSDSLDETKEKAKAYVPIMQKLLGLSTGSDLFDILSMLLFGGGTFALRKQIRKVGHFFTHNGPQKKEVVS